MTTRFEMVEALVNRAKKLHGEIGDHGDSYEEALLILWFLDTTITGVHHIVDKLKNI